MTICKKGSEPCPLEARIDRSVSVKDQGSRSALRAQRFGISQGVALSPFLFVVVMSVVLIGEAKDEFRREPYFRTGERLFVQELRYANEPRVNAETAVVKT